jgi:hypothetical protein
MQRTLSLVVAFLMLTSLGSALPAPPDIKAQVTGFAPGEKIEVHLNHNKTARGARGAVTASGFTLVDSHGQERQIAFMDVISVDQIRSHIGRNIAIVAGVAAVALLVLVVYVGHQVSGGHGG